MDVHIFPEYRFWYARVELTPQQWPPIDRGDLWLERPIYTWVTQDCEHSTNFTYYGHILFAHEDDLVKFLLTWS